MNKRKVCTFLIVAGIVIMVCYMGKTIIQQRSLLDSKNTELSISKINSEPIKKYISVPPLILESMVSRGDTVFSYIGNNECSDCSLFYPTFDKIIEKEDIINNVVYVEGKFLKKNVVEWKEFKKRNNFSETPVFIIYKDGKILDKIEWDSKNGLSEEKFSSWIERNIEVIRSIEY